MNLSDLVNEYKRAGYDKYRLSGGQLIDEGGQVMMNATPEDIQRYKEYQHAQFAAGNEPDPVPRAAPRPMATKQLRLADLMADNSEAGVTFAQPDPYENETHRLLNYGTQPEAIPAPQDPANVRLNKMMSGGTTGGWSNQNGRRTLTIQGGPRVEPPSPQDLFQKEAMRVLQDPAIPMAQKIDVYKSLQKAPSEYDNALSKERAKNTAAAEASKIPGTQEYKRDQDLNDKRAKASKMADSTKRYADDTAASMERAIADILGTTPDKLPEMLGQNTGAAKNAVSNAVGNLDARYPEFMKWQGTRNTSSAIESLKSKAQMFGLSNLRQSGVAPGSITEKEWPKFESLLANIDPTLGEEAFVKQLADIYRQVKAGRDAGALDYSQMTDGNGAAMSDELVTMQDVFDTAKSTGKSIDQVIQDARAAGLTIRGM